MKKENGNIKQFKKSDTKKDDAKKSAAKKDNLFADFNKKRAGHQVSKMMWVFIIVLALFLIAAVGFVVARVFFINKEYTSVTEVSSTEFFISTGSATISSFTIRTVLNASITRASRSGTKLSRCKNPWLIFQTALLR